MSLPAVQPNKVVQMYDPISNHAGLRKAQTAGDTKVVFSSSSRYTKGLDFLLKLGNNKNTVFSESRYYADYARDVYRGLRTSTGISTVQLYCAMISSLPFKLLSARGKEQELPVWIERPGGPQFREITFRTVVSQIVSSMLLDGIAYVALKRSPTGEIVGLIPLEPWAVRSEINSNGRQFRVLNSGINQTGYDYLHSYTNVSLGFKEGEVGNHRIFDVEDMLIWNGGVTVPGLSRGVSPFDLASSAVNIAIEVQDYAEEHYASNAARPTVFIFREKLVSQDRRNLSDSIADQFTGEHRHNVRALFVNDPVNDVKIEQVGDLPRDADVAEVRQYNSQEIAQALRVPLPLAGIADPGSSSYNSIHVLKAHFASSVIAPIVKTIEDGFSWALPKGHKLTFDMRDITRGDPMTNTQIAERLKNAGITSTDESREQVGLEPAGYDDLIVNKNSVLLDDVIDGKTIQMPAVDDNDDGEIPQSTGRPEGEGDGIAETSEPPE